MSSNQPGVKSYNTVFPFSLLSRYWNIYRWWKEYSNTTVLPALYSLSKSSEVRYGTQSAKIHTITHVVLCRKREPSTVRSCILCGRPSALVRMGRNSNSRRKAASIGRRQRKGQPAECLLATTITAAVAHVRAHAHVHAREADGLVAHGRISIIRI